jgi:Family of unknown function (DUF5670)
VDDSAILYSGVKSVEKQIDGWLADGRRESAPAGHESAIGKENPMLWTIVVTLITLWLLGLLTGFTMGSFIHILFAMAVVLVLVSINQEVAIYRGLRHISRSRR